MSRAVVRELIDKMGGPQAVAELARVEPGTVSAWQTRIGRFPSDTYLLFKHELRRRGVPEKALPASLWRMKRHPELVGAVSRNS